MPRANVKRKPRSKYTQPAWIIGIVVGVMTVTGMAWVTAARNAAPEPAPAAQSDDATTPAVKAAPVASSAKPSPAKSKPGASNDATPASSTATVSTGVVKGEVISITGCLELDNQEYKLTKTEGADAPKSRSWKSGFLAKRGTDVEVVDTAKTLRLATHLGQRVTLTGAVNDRTMEAWSLVVAARSCK